LHVAGLNMPRDHGHHLISNFTIDIYIRTDVKSFWPLYSPHPQQSLAISKCRIFN